LTRETTRVKEFGRRKEKLTMQQPDYSNLEWLVREKSGKTDGGGRKTSMKARQKRRCSGNSHVLMESGEDVLARCAGGVSSL